MLVLSRKVGERILIGDQIAVTIVRVTGGGVRVGIEAPPELAVLRAEIKSALEIPPTNSAANSPLVPKNPDQKKTCPDPSKVPATIIANKTSETSLAKPSSEVPILRKPR